MTCWWCVKRLDNLHIKFPTNNNETLISGGFRVRAHPALPRSRGQAKLIDQKREMLFARGASHTHTHALNSSSSSSSSFSRQTVSTRLEWHLKRAKWQSNVGFFCRFSHSWPFWEVTLKICVCVCVRTKTARSKQNRYCLLVFHIFPAFPSLEKWGRGKRIIKLPVGGWLFNDSRAA